MYYDFIRSKTLREYYDKNNIELSDFEQAVMMLHGCCRDPYYENLGSFMETLQDTNVKDDISKYIKREKEIKEEFERQTDDTVYVLSLSKKSYINNVILPLDKAYKKGIDTGGNFSIFKHKVISEEDAETMTIDNDFYTENYSLYHVDDGDMYSYYGKCDEPIFQKIENDYCTKFKHPFRNGDFVLDINNMKIGVVSDVYCVDDESMEKYYQEPKDEYFCFNDMGIQCEWINLCTGGVYDEMTFPWFLEKIEIDNLPYEINNALRWVSSCITHGTSCANMGYALSNLRSFIERVGTDNIIDFNTIKIMEDK